MIFAALAFAVSIGFLVWLGCSTLKSLTDMTDRFIGRNINTKKED